MEPTLDPKTDYIYVDMLNSKKTKKDEYKVGDVVYMIHPYNPTVKTIKRIRAVVRR